MAGLKSWASQQVADGAEDARKCCGGQGYLMISGRPEIVASVTAYTTFEGENYVMWQQVSRYLMEGVISASPPTDMEYIIKHKLSPSGPCEAENANFRSPEVILAIFRHRAARLTLEGASMLAMAEARGSSTRDVWNEHMMALISTARAYIDVAVLESFNRHVSAIKLGPVRNVLDRLLSLYGLTTIVSPSAVDSITFVEVGHLSSPQLNQIRSQINILLEEILSDALDLTDAFNFSDASLCSAIGNAGDNAYEALMNCTKQMSINQNKKTADGFFDQAFRGSIRPVLTRQEQQERAGRVKYIWEYGKFKV